MIKYIIIFTSVFTLQSCLFHDDKFIRKHIQNEGISIDWFFYSYISNNSPDFITVIKNGEEKIIFEASRRILDVNFNNDTIILKLVKPDEELRSTGEDIVNSVFGYKIVLDTSGSYMDLQNIPDGIR